MDFLQAARHTSANLHGMQRLQSADESRVRSEVSPHRMSDRDFPHRRGGIGGFLRSFGQRIWMRPRILVYRCLRLFPCAGAKMNGKAPARQKDTDYRAND